MKKRTIQVEVLKQGKVWRLNITGTGSDTLDKFAQFIRGLAEVSGLVILNTSDPFGITIPRKKRAKKLRDLPVEHRTATVANRYDREVVPILDEKV